MKVQRGRVKLLAVMLLLLVASAFAQTDVTLGDAAVAPGGKVSVPINVSGADTVAGVNFAIGYDPAVLSNPTVELGTLTEGMTIDSNDIKEGDPAASIGEFRFLIYSDPVKNFTAGEGTIALLNFDVAANATQCSSSDLDLAIDKISVRWGFSNDQGVSTTADFNPVDNFVQVTLPGDFNGDAQVNDTDYFMLNFYWGEKYADSDYFMLTYFWNSSCD